MQGLPWHPSKNAPAKAGDAVHPIVGEDALEKEMAAHSSLLAWKSLMGKGAQQSLPAVSSRT